MEPLIKRASPSWSASWGNLRCSWRSQKKLQSLECSKAQKRNVIERLAETYPVSTVCNVWNFPRSTFYQARHRPDDSTLRHALEQAATEWPTYGSRRLTAQLRRQGWEVNRKRIRRLMWEMSLMRAKKREKRRTTQSQHSLPRYAQLVRDLAVVRPN